MSRFGCRTAGSSPFRTTSGSGDVPRSKDDAWEPDLRQSRVAEVLEAWAQQGSRRVYHFHNRAMHRHGGSSSEVVLRELAPLAERLGAVGSIADLSRSKSVQLNCVMAPMLAALEAGALSTAGLENLFARADDGSSIRSLLGSAWGPRHEKRYVGPATVGTGVRNAPRRGDLVLFDRVDDSFRQEGELLHLAIATGRTVPGQGAKPETEVVHFWMDTTAEKATRSDVQSNALDQALRIDTIESLSRQMKDTFGPVCARYVTAPWASPLVRNAPVHETLGVIQTESDWRHYEFECATPRFWTPALYSAAPVPRARPRYSVPFAHRNDIVKVELGGLARGPWTWRRMTRDILDGTWRLDVQAPERAEDYVYKFRVTHKDGSVTFEPDPRSAFVTHDWQQNSVAQLP